MIVAAAATGQLGRLVVRRRQNGKHVTYQQVSYDRYRHILTDRGELATTTGELSRRARQPRHLHHAHTSLERFDT
jgi:hypothetical protein